MVTGLDLVALQLRIAAGERLPFRQEDVRRTGAAIECRITAEDARGGFLPASGRVDVVRLPSGPGMRVDTALEPGALVPTEYDPLIAKIVAHGRDRPEALARMRRALRETAIGGVPTTTAFHAFAVSEPDLVSGRYDTSYVGTHWPPPDEEVGDGAATAAAIAVVLAARAPRTSIDRDGARSAWAEAARLETLRE
jgi:acetyl/propionyl-CoA carboxylase alpha subunit